MEKGQFQLQSRLFFIYPEYNKIEGSQNFDICLIKTAADEYGVHYDLSSKFDSIPCLPDEINLKKVHSFMQLSSAILLVVGAWKSLLGRRLGTSSIKWRFIRLFEINRRESFRSRLLQKP